MKLRTVLEIAAGALGSWLFLRSGPTLGELERTVILARVLAALLVGGALTLALRAATRGPAALAALSAPQKAFAKEWLLQSLVALAVLSLWLAAQWPGFVFFDTRAVYRELEKGRLNDWFSALFALYLLTLQQIWGNGGVVALVHVLVVAIGAAFLCSFTSYKGVDRRICRGVLALFLLIPLNGAMTISIQRDLVFSWCHLATALFFPYYRLTRKDAAQPRQGLVAGYGLLAICTARLRLEMLYLIPLFPLVLRQALGWSRKSVASFCAYCLVFWLLIFGAMPYWTRTGTGGSLYKLTAIFSPLSYFVHSGFRTNTFMEDYRQIDELIDYSVLKTTYDPFDIPAFRLIRKPFKAEKWPALVRLYLRLVVTNPRLFLENRAVMFRAMIGLGPKTVYVYDDLEPDNPSVLEQCRRFGLVKTPASEWLHASAYWSPRAGYSGSPFAWIVDSAVIALLLLVAILASYRYVPATASAGLIIAARLVIVFLTTPTMHFRYIYALYLFGFFAPLFAWAELKARRKESVVS